MKRKEWSQMPTLRLVYMADVEGTIIPAAVKVETPKQFNIVEEGRFKFSHIVSKDATGMAKWHDTPHAALEGRAEELRGRIAQSEIALNAQRAWLGMVTSALAERAK